ncbi:hypothetical protein FXO37_24589 [Capsicum annuum]|nr:hypothetical protein FXO37_24589 [Capsicum annuum]
MKSSSRTSFYSCSGAGAGAGAGAATIAYCTEGVQSGPKIIQIPVQSAPEDGDHNAAVKIQSIYRSYVVRNLVKKISAVNSEANFLQRLIQRQFIYFEMKRRIQNIKPVVEIKRWASLLPYHVTHLSPNKDLSETPSLPAQGRGKETVDAVRSSERERIKMNEALMGLLLRLDSVPGVDPTVRELRRDLSRRIVGLQEILDAVSDTKIQNWDGFLMDWDDVVERMEMDVCKERGGGNELETFCAEHLGLRCLQRFLRDQ